MIKVLNHYRSFFLIIPLVINFSCDKEKLKWNLERNNTNDTISPIFGVSVPNENCPKILTGNYSNLTQNSASISGEITAVGASEITSYGHCWSVNTLPTISNNHTNHGSTQNLLNFQSLLTSLNPSTKYYVRAYATNSFGTSYGNEIEIQTNDLIPSLISTIPCNSLSDITSSYYHWHGSNYDTHPWSISTSGYNGTCFIANSGIGASPNGGYIEFPVTLNHSGYLTFWILSCDSGTFYYANLIPDVYVDGLQLPTPTIVGGTSEVTWQKIKTSSISSGNHVIKIDWPNTNHTRPRRIDDIELWEY
jgi:hypothetical protein